MSSKNHSDAELGQGDLGPLRDALRGLDVADEDQLADRIRDVAHNRRAHGLGFDLGDAIEAVPRLKQSELALDAAIDEALSDPAAGVLDLQAQALIERFPDLSVKIHRAALLRVALGSNSGVPTIDTAVRLPCRMGPVNHDGQPRYELYRKLGSGAQGSVYAANDTLFAQPEVPVRVAVKIFHQPEREASVSPREAQLARRIAHPAIVRFLDAGRLDDGRAFAVAELVEGLPLDVWVRARSSPLPMLEAARLVAEIAGGIQAAHSAGLVHGDLKPSNIMIDSTGMARITDFGVASEFEIPASASDAFSTRGSLAFMAPEQFRLEPHGRAPASDVYALGGLLYWLLTGKLPNGDSVSAAIDRLDQVDPLPDPQTVSISHRKVNQSVIEVCTRAMRANAEERHPSAAALADDLRKCIERRPIEWLHPHWYDRLYLLARRRPTGCGIAVAALAALIIVAMSAVHASGQTRLEKERSSRALEQAAKAREVESLRQRAEAQQKLIDQARNLVELWRGVLQASEDISDEQYLAVTMLLEGADLTEDVSPGSMLSDERVDVGLAGIEKLREQGLGQTLQAALWHDLISTWSFQAGDSNAARSHAAQAERILLSIESSDPWLIRLRHFNDDAAPANN